MVRYEAFIDEAWTHSGPDVGRYHCFYGALFGESSNLDRLETELRQIRERHGHKKEIKWQSLNALTLPLYHELLRCTLAHVDSGRVRFRQMFYDRACVRVGDADEEERSGLDVQFLLCYQFLKHGLGFRHAPWGTEILVRLDTHSSQRHRDNLEDYAARIPRQLSRPDLRLRCTYHKSTSMMRIQLVDVLIGAAGFYGNRLYERRENGAKRISAKQKLKRDFAKSVYDGLRKISNAERDAAAFNWFESTGARGVEDHRFTRKVHIWKFTPKTYRIDKGWENDHLVKGRYVGEDINPTIRTCGEMRSAAPE